MIHSKKCFKCEAVKPLSDFYKHPEMLDGHVNKCKECNKLDVRENRNKNIEYYREYDKTRLSKPNRIDSIQKHQKKYKQKYPYKKIATSAIAYLIKTKKIIKPASCEICNETGRIHGHHDDYSKPYEVRWLCVRCHINWHQLNTAKYPF
jgi:hypothetical protein